MDYVWLWQHAQAEKFARKSYLRLPTTLSMFRLAHNCGASLVSLDLRLKPFIVDCVRVLALFFHVTDGKRHQSIRETARSYQAFSRLLRNPVTDDPDLIDWEELRHYMNVRHTGITKASIRAHFNQSCGNFTCSVGTRPSPEQPAMSSCSRCQRVR
ncbi:hypothetical protein M427DRAFT_355315 [Gonapodya prolifera JEL478]|uniref:Uncharacterized protein n=1 Tax=Gonapodya prolifera (strain JEL478) TaxID=1344416 RepID=A0A139ABJ5_GONPJ|nr:hypothetical protein M427DRAFT_355315 [Gonapodya prolifera JEL478]|eukprot:KXS14161.1 hypothetical protein M427DRAFT_355315 [Gonapodya prolifera JEL478]